MMPGEDDAVLLLERMGCDRKVIEHCKAVHHFATRISERLIRNGVKVDDKLVRIGALLHDIGRARTQEIDHAVVGAGMARDMGLDEAIVNIIERHIGAGIPASEAKDLGLPERDFVPETIEEKIVAHADNMVLFKKHPIERTLEKLEKKGKEAVAAKMRLLHQELSELAGMDLDDL